jgi:hypothetical protein
MRMFPASADGGTPSREPRRCSGHHGEKTIPLVVCVALIALGLLSADSARAAVVYDAAADFSATNNPDGVWSFGSQFPTLGVGFNLSTASGSFLGFDYWSANPNVGLPTANHNPTDSTITGWGTAVIEAGQLVLHPGPFGEYSVARFTAPASATYSFSASFVGQDNVLGTTTDVHLLKNSTPLFSGNVAGFHNTVSSGVFVMSLNAGDTLSAAVGFGANGNFSGDSTGVSFTVTAIPESAPILAMILVGLGSFTVRNCKRWASATLHGA